jgi:cytochrome c-type biogenesis protein CcmH
MVASGASRGHVPLRRRTSRLGWVPWLALAAVVVIAGVVLAARSGPSNSPSARAERLDNELACPVCVGESVSDSNAPESRAIRVDIVKRIHAGQADAEIRDAYVAIYGEHILLTPSNSGVGIIAWGLPIVALVLGGAGIVFAVRRSSNTPRLAATTDDEAVVDRERHREEVGAGERADPDGDS